jgi:hypothetical protein
LPEEKRASQEESVADFAVIDKSSERLPESKTDSCMLMLERGIDRRNFFEHIDIVGVELSNPAEVLECLGALTTAHEPTWRFSDEEESDEHQASWDELDCEWNEPLFSGWFHCRGDTVIDPEANDSADLPAHLVKSNQSSSNCRRG